MPPTVHAGVAPDPIAFASLPATVGLDFTATVPGTGTISEYSARVKSKPLTSAADLSSGSSATPSITIDVPGTYTIEVNAKNSANEWAWDPARPWDVPYVMPTALIHIVATTENLALEKPALGEATMRDHPTVTLVPGDEGFTDAWTKMDGLFDAVDALGGTAGRQYVKRHATAAAGSATADGSEGRPFNATSASAKGFAGPIAQAKASLDAITSDYDAGRVLVLNGGNYTEAVALTTRLLTTIQPIGNVVLSNATTRLRISTNATKQAAAVGFIIDGPGALTVSALTLKNPDIASPLVWARRLTAASVAIEDAVAGIPTLRFVDCSISGAFNVPNASFRILDSTIVAGDFIARDVWQSNETKLGGDIGLSAVSSSIAVNGFYGCGFTKTAPVFTGPSGSARFDSVTARRFFAAHGTFSGGAHTGDFVGATIVRVAAVPVTLNSLSDVTAFLTSAFHDFGVTAGWSFVLEAVVDVNLLGGHSCQVQITAAGESGARKTVIASHGLLTGGVTTPVYLNAWVDVVSVGDPGYIMWRWEVSDGDGATVEDKGKSYENAFDLDPSIIRFNVQVDPGGAFSSTSECVLRRFRTVAFPPGA